MHFVSIGAATRRDLERDVRKSCRLLTAFAVCASPAAFAPPALAQSSPPAVEWTAVDAPDALCPTTPLSVYFAAGEVGASDKTRALIGKLQAAARDCRPDEVRLVAIVDVDQEGEAAEGHARQRLDLLKSELEAGGLAADRIVVALKPGRSTPSPESRINAVEVLFWRKDISPIAPEGDALREGEPVASEPRAIAISL